MSRSGVPASLALLTSAALVLCACHVGPNYHAPPLPEGTASSLISANPAEESAAAPPDAWWRLYDDSRLDALIREAFQANRDLRAADANFAAARAVLSAAHAERYPSTELSVSGLYGRDPVTEEILELGGHSPKSIWLLDDVFQAAYEVDLFGHVHRAIEAAHANADAAAWARNGVRVVVAAETARAYAAVCALGEQLDVAHHSLEVVEREARITEQRQAAGGGSEFDVTRAQALVAEVRSSIPPLEGQRRAALFELTALLGRAPARAPYEVEACVTPPHLASLVPVGDGASLIRRRPDVREAERRLAAATAEIGVTTAELYPIVHLLGFYGGAAFEFNQLTTNNALIWGVGPSISWSFPNQAGARARVRRAKASQAAALASFDSITLTALKETEEALALYGAVLHQRGSLIDTQEKTRKAYTIAHDGLQAGAISFLDLLTTEQSLVTADAAVAASDASLVQGQIAVFKALGGGWQSETEATTDREARP